MHVVGGGHDGRIGWFLAKDGQGETTMAIEAVRSDGGLEAEKDGVAGCFLGLRWRWRGKQAGERKSKNKKEDGANAKASLS